MKGLNKSSALPADVTDPAGHNSSVKILTLDSRQTRQIESEAAGKQLNKKLERCNSNQQTSYLTQQTHMATTLDQLMKAVAHVLDNKNERRYLGHTV